MDKKRLVRIKFSDFLWNYLCIIALLKKIACVWCSNKGSSIKALPKIDVKKTASVRRKWLNYWRIKHNARIKSVI